MTSTTQPTRRTRRRFGRYAVVPAAAALALAVAAPASAHVTVTPSQTAAGSETVLTFSVPHGCDGSPTTKLTISIPDTIAEVTPTRTPFYDLSTVTSELDPPLTAEDGDQITERTSQVVYTATTALPADERDTFELALEVPEDAAGQSLTFPAVQTCQDGEVAWTEVPASGQSEDDLDHPAPAFEVTAATGGGHHGAAVTGAVATSTATGPARATTSTQDGGHGTAFGLAGLVAGILGLLLGGLALARTRGGSAPA